MAADACDCISPRYLTLYSSHNRRRRLLTPRPRPSSLWKSVSRCFTSVPFRSTAIPSGNRVESLLVNTPTTPHLLSLFLDAGAMTIYRRDTPSPKRTSHRAPTPHLRPVRRSRPSTPAASRDSSPAPSFRAPAPTPVSEPAPEAERTPAVIDHTALPHILDAICAHAPHGALLALRTASRGWRDRVDALLHAHVVLCPDLIPRTAAGDRLPFYNGYAAAIGTLDLVDLGPLAWTPSPTNELRSSAGSYFASRLLPSPSPSASPSTSPSTSPTTSPSVGPISPSAPISRRRRPPPPLPSSVDTLRIIGDLDWTCTAPRLPTCSSCVISAPLPLLQSSIYTPRLATPRGLTDSHACAAFLATCPKLVLALPTSLRGTSVYVLADVILAQGSAVREIEVVAEEGADERGDWREGIAALCCLLGATLLNRSEAEWTDGKAAGELRYTLVNVLEAGAKWRHRQMVAAGALAEEEWGEDGFWHDGMGLFRLAGHEFARPDDEVQARMERSVEFMGMGEYEVRVGKEAGKVAATV